MALRGRGAARLPMPSCRPISRSLATMPTVAAVATAAMPTSSSGPNGLVAKLWKPSPSATVQLIVPKKCLVSVVDSGSSERSIGKSGLLGTNASTVAISW